MIYACAIQNNMWLAYRIMHRQAFSNIMSSKCQLCRALYLLQSVYSESFAIPLVLTMSHSLFDWYPKPPLWLSHLISTNHHQLVPQSIRVVHIFMPRLQSLVLCNHSGNA